jgi:hypothetical protein
MAARHPPPKEGPSLSSSELAGILASFYENQAKACQTLAKDLRSFEKSARKVEREDSKDRASSSRKRKKNMDPDKPK